jgi:hypothetical protein
MDAATFVERWAKSLEFGSAAVFIGAGLSQRAGYPSWRRLLRDIAHELGLDIEAEHDLAAVAQYSVNRAVGKRNQLARLIAEEFPPKPQAPEPLRILARLPLRHVWTTNYDSLPEIAWREERKLLDVKSRNEDLGVDKPWAHNILYKMHGSVDHPADVVIAKDDYELYRTLRPGFLQLLNGDLISKQFLFLGFSFTDPNLAHLFASIRESFRQNGPEHYAVVRRPSPGAGKNARKRHATETVRHRLWVEDLMRYGIQCIEIDEHEEIDDILRDVETTLSRRSVMIAGSFPDVLTTAEIDRRGRIEAIARGVGRLVAERGKRLISGFGLVVGSASLSGALGAVLAENTPNLEKSLMLRPFPQEAPQGIDYAVFKRRYRESLVQQAGACVVIAGEKEVQIGQGTERVIADGVLEESHLARQSGRAVIPIGATGGAAAVVWQEFDSVFQDHWPKSLRKHFDLLNNRVAPPEDIVAAVGRFLDHLEKNVRQAARKTYKSAR